MRRHGGRLGARLGASSRQWSYRPGHPDLEVKSSTNKARSRSPSSRSRRSTGLTRVRISSQFDVVPRRANRCATTRRVEKATDHRHPCLRERPKLRRRRSRFAVVADVKLDVPRTCFAGSSPARPPRAGAGSPPSRSAKRPTRRRIEALERSLASKPSFWGVRAHVASALGETRLGSAFDVLKAHVKTKHQGPARRRPGARSIPHIRGIAGA